MNEAAALFADDDDSALEALAAVAGAAREGRNSGAEFEAFLREQWDLPELNVEAEIRSAEAGHVQVRASDEDQDDYSDEEWIIVRTMRSYCKDAITPSTAPRRLQKCIEWLFVRGTEDSRQGVSFHLACDMLRARYWVVQALIQHHWFLRGMQIPTLPFMADSLPEAIEHDAILRGWNASREIMHGIWRKPSVLEPDLRDALEIDLESYDRVLHGLVEHGLVGNKLGRLYVTSRPADFRRARQVVSWSNSFVGE